MTTRPSIIAHWLAILRARPDSEHEMTLNRIAFAAIVIVYLALATAAGQSHAAEIFHSVYHVFLAYLVGALALFAHILYRPAAVPARRIVAAIYDMAMISYAAEATGTASGFFYPLYLWTIFGNGFRFGVAYLFISMAIAIAGFTIVLVRTGFWTTNFGFSAALLIGLVMLPMYVSRLIRKLSEAKRQAEDASRAKSQFLASVSHELRTPLNAIIGLSSLFDAEKLDREHSEMIETIGAAGRTLLGHINSILDLSRIEAGRMTSENVEFDLYELLVHVRNIVAVQQKQLRVSIHITSRTPCLLVGTRQQLEEILLNLAGNAVKFTPSGYVVIAADAVSEADGRIRMRFEVSDTGIGILPAAQERIFESFVQADDTIIHRFGGTGLGLALCKQVVESQGGQIGVKSSPGAGSTFWFEINVGYRPEQAVSLTHCEPVVLIDADDELKAAVRSVASNVRFAENVEQASGELKYLEHLAETEVVAVFDCRPRDGAAEMLLKSGLSYVPIFIRRTDSDAQGLMADPTRSYYTTSIKHGAGRAELISALHIAMSIGRRRVVPKRTLYRAQPDRKLSILVADDNRTNLLVLSKVLERAGHTVTAVENGAFAVEALIGNSFDVALMDLNMPVLNGIDAFKQYRNSLRGRVPTPVIALTADATTEARARCAEAGFQACATKPIEPRHLLELVAQVTPQSAIESESPGLVPEPNHETPDLAVPVPKASIRRETLRKLEQLGGRPFVEDLIKQFSTDTEEMLHGLKLALAKKDASEFDDQLHAVRSAAGNIGASSLYSICLALKRITCAELKANGDEHLRRLAAEVEQLRKELADYLAEPVAETNRVADFVGSSG
jgi:two-component system sensor histidine kinase RpfC